MAYFDAPSIIAISFIFPLLGIFTLGLRYYFRITKKQDFGSDDLLSAAALVFTTGAGVTLTLGCALHVIGYHSASPKTSSDRKHLLHEIILLQKVEFAFTIFQFLALGFTKLSILYFYRRIFRGRVFNYLDWTLVGATAIWTAAWALLLVFQCGTHVEYEWSASSSLVNSKCLSNNALFVAHCVTDIVLDIVIMGLPIPLIWRLQMARKQKVSVTVVFLFGAFSIAAGILRLGIVVDTQLVATPAAAATLHLGIHDTLGIAGLLYFWSYMEIGVAMVISCLITLRPASAMAAFDVFAGQLRSISGFDSLRSRIAKSGSKNSQPAATSAPSSQTSSKKALRIETMQFKHKPQSFCLVEVARVEQGQRIYGPQNC